MRINKWLLPMLALVLLLGTVGIAQAAGWWVVSGREMVDLAQLAGGADVKGWMTLQQVADGTGIETAALYAKLSLPADIPATTALKDIEGMVEGFEITTVRTVVDEVLGPAPAGDDEEAEVPEPTATVVQTPANAGSSAGTVTESADEEERPAVTSAASIKGSHTLQEIVDGTGVNLEALLADLNLPSTTDAHTSVRELVQGGHLTEVDQVRTAVARLQ